MGLTEKLLNKTIFIDTAPLIYFIEGHSQYQDILQKLFEANDNGQVIFQTSTLTLLEVLVQPIRYNNLKLADQYSQILTTSPNIHIFDIDVEVSGRAAKLRAKYNLKTPDAIQIATGIEKEADIFFTNDAGLKKVTEVKVITLKELIDSSFS